MRKKVTKGREEVAARGPKDVCPDCPCIPNNPCAAKDKRCGLPGFTTKPFNCGSTEAPNAELTGGRSKD